MTVAVGLSARGRSTKTGRRGATLEGIDWLFGSGVAPRRALFPNHHSVGSSPRLPSRSRSAMLVVGCWLLVVGCWLLVVGCWLLVVGWWLLVVGCWLLVVGCWLLF